ncbi:hypothetical protein FHR81_003990 [Actinoalloteichus hoggarensis]|uniref:Uncharacterized protein n=1 Tax=Actinoalloteichus hoggarensis TaxID=1470176 RepID=A0A221VW85_9PSEU|nr:hypothetical protein AHOG_00665 [Actinoalloteichus hoggarensis]MBB5922933.1 hypothetical protein [Actinoalloteichus hoggarensis]
MNPPSPHGPSVRMTAARRARAGNGPGSGDPPARFGAHRHPTAAPPAGSPDARHPGSIPAADAGVETRRTRRRPSASGRSSASTPSTDRFDRSRPDHRTLPATDHSRATDHDATVADEAGRGHRIDSTAFHRHFTSREVPGRSPSVTMNASKNQYPKWNSTCDRGSAHRSALGAARDGGDSVHRDDIDARRPTPEEWTVPTSTGHASRFITTRFSGFPMPPRVPGGLAANDRTGRRGSSRRNRALRATAVRRLRSGDLVGGSARIEPPRFRSRPLSPSGRDDSARRRSPSCRHTTSGGLEREARRHAATPPPAASKTRLPTMPGYGEPAGRRRAVSRETGVGSCLAHRVEDIRREDGRRSPRESRQASDEWAGPVDRARQRPCRGIRRAVPRIVVTCRS